MGPQPAPGLFAQVQRI